MRNNYRSFVCTYTVARNFRLSPRQTIQRVVAASEMRCTPKSFRRHFIQPQGSWIQGPHSKRLHQSYAATSLSMKIQTVPFLPRSEGDEMKSMTFVPMDYQSGSRWNSMHRLRRRSMTALAVISITGATACGKHTRGAGNHKGRHSPARMRTTPRSLIIYKS
ncbi:hypothetical protein DAEQUDRAFT_210803 [Daedalea quercina L-15889]|uniref:Uncharacterized protein n=1 Tax=Daedalea quercina L-15889 TaxID=1314783 RepID=A0A165RAR3_9APHY|nr:hypothetical protein DAEQUDRAFT_210803 [Daedalea quercina L-15889]